MSQAKTERLVNLTMALLDSRRYMRKSEIFRKVAGYSGSDETKERMFERDKDDLRALGIDIEVASHDPLFEDEPGYRIRPESYQFPVSKFSSEENALISTALNLWGASELSGVASSAAQRVVGGAHSHMGIFEDSITPNEFSESGLTEITRALASRSRITFDYQKNSNESKQTRKVNPFGLSTWQGNWYLVGEDLDRGDMRVFRLTRITSKIEISPKRETYQIPSDFKITDYMVMLNQSSLTVRWKIKKNRAHALRGIAQEISELDENWDWVIAQIENIESAIALSLWHFDSVVLEEPKDARQEIQRRFEEVISKYA